MGKKRRAKGRNHHGRRAKKPQSKIVQKNLNTVEEVIEVEEEVVTTPPERNNATSRAA